MEHAPIPGSPSRGARGNSPRLTPNRIFASHLGSILKDKQKELHDAEIRAAGAADSPKSVPAEVKVEEADAEEPTDTDLQLRERQEPYGAECENEDQHTGFDGVGEEIRIQLTTEIYLIPLPGEESATAQLDVAEDKLTDDDVSKSIHEEHEQPSAQVIHQKTRKSIAESEDSVRRRSSKSGKKRKKTSRSPMEGESDKSSSSGPRRGSHRSKRNEESPDRNPSPSKRRSKHSNGVAQDDVSVQVWKEENDAHRSVSLIKLEGEPLSTPKSRRDSSEAKVKSLSSVSTPRCRRKEREEAGSRSRHSSPMHLYPSSSWSTPVKTKDSASTEPMNAMHKLQLRKLKADSKMSSSEHYVDVPVSSASDDEIIDHEVFTVKDCQREVESPSIMSSRSGSGCSKPSSAADFIPFCSPRPVYVRQDLQYYTSPPMMGMTEPPHAPTWHYPNPTFPPSPAMHQGVIQWQGENERDAIASLVKYPPPPHPTRHSFVGDLPPPPGTEEYPFRRYSLPCTGEYNPAHIYPFPPLDHSPLVTTPSTEPVPVLDRRYSRLQPLHDPPKPNIFGYQLIGDSMLVRFASQILKEPPTLAESLRFLGYCVSGQRIGDLLKRLKSDFYHLGDKVVLMIGTNDLVKNSSADQMITELRRVLEYLCTKTKKIVVLTLPPVPRFEQYSHHWARLNRYNDYIKSLAGADDRISVYDISPQYLLSKEELEEEELLAVFNSESPFCRGCLTCMEEVEEFIDSSWSDEDDIMEADLLTSVFVSTSPPHRAHVSHVDICNLYISKRIPKCKLDYFELTFSEHSSRKDMIHLNHRGLQLIKKILYDLL